MRVYSTILITGVIATMLLTGAGCSSGSTTETRVKPAVSEVSGYTYYDQMQKFGFKMQLPKEWEKEETADESSMTTAFYAPLEDANDGYRENAIMTAITLSPDEELSLKDLATAAHDGLKGSIDNLETADAGEVSISGIKGRKYIFTGTIDNGGIKFKVKGAEYFIVTNNRAYNFTFGAAASKFDQATATFDKILNTVELE